MAVDIIARGMAANAGGGGGPVDAYTKAETNALLNEKQNNLISEQNIKSINGVSILGEGNMEVGKKAYKHIVHIQLVGESVEPFENNDLYFTIRNYDSTEIETFEELMDNFEPYETIVVYNAQLNNTNTCITRVTENQATYSGENYDPVDVTGDDVVVIGDNVKPL